MSGENPKTEYEEKFWKLVPDGKGLSKLMDERMQRTGESFVEILLDPENRYPRPWDPFGPDGKDFQWADQ